MKSDHIKSWIEAMRLRTLPVSIAGVLAGCGCAKFLNSFKPIPAILCLLFALLAQIASNFANEYYDYKNGLDKKGRDGFRRGVTEGDIKPSAMKKAVFITLFLASTTGCMLLWFGPIWLLGIGIVITIFALAYSTGPFPLSHNGLGDVTVILFFGITPVCLTCFLQTGNWDSLTISLPISIAIGLLAANVLIVNNYRDYDDDRAVNKKTTVVIFGRQFMSFVYLFFGIVAIALTSPIWTILPHWTLIIPVLSLSLHILLWLSLKSKNGAELNPILGKTAMNLLLFSTLLTIALSIN